ncbi:MAG TPA: beta-ribofuranosylaminobenzene 5'-phosphate synthase family protein [Ideonella sp.]|nr:beta-ribofuranosylaminobenzene 5'-phosphate synthase family protein [Ideonella sp.]
MSATCSPEISPSTPPRADAAAIRLQAPGRLHLGFLDPAGTLGRSFGSLGLVIDGFETVLELGAAALDSVTADTPSAHAEVERAAGYLQQLRQRSGRHEPLHLRLLQVLPPHAGFGSGTQLALAIGRAFAQWHGLALDSATLARWLGRGGRSGIGIAGFDQGGLLVDGGPGADGTPAPLLSRIALPEAWRIVVVQDTHRRGLSGSQEKQAIARLAPLPQAAAADICHQVMMRVLPGASRAEFAPFAAGISHIQQVLGEHFAPAQGGSAYTSTAVGQLVQWIAEGSRGGTEAPTHHGAAIGQSSWGPTGFAILPSQAQAEAVVEAARTAGLIGPSLAVRIVRGRNTGATVLDPRSAARAAR